MYLNFDTAAVRGLLTTLLKMSLIDDYGLHNSSWQIDRAPRGVFCMILIVEIRDTYACLGVVEK